MKVAQSASVVEVISLEHNLSTQLAAVVDVPQHLIPLPINP
jgi:hypothetical protein